MIIDEGNERSVYMLLNLLDCLKNYVETKDVYNFDLPLQGDIFKNFFLFGEVSFQMCFEQR